MMDLETQNHVIELFSQIAEEADYARHSSDVSADPDQVRIHLARILEIVAEMEQRIPPTMRSEGETALARAKRLMPGWPNRLCPTDYTKDFPDEIDENS